MSLFSKKFRIYLLAIIFLLSYYIPCRSILATPVDLDQVIESFKTSRDLNLKLDLAYKGLDFYAPIKEKSRDIDADDRNSLSEMKRLMLIDLFRQRPKSILMSAIGSTGNWLLDPNLIKNDYDANVPEQTARFKHKGYYMEGMSDLDFSAMGTGARSYVQSLYEVLAKGRAGHDLTPSELEQLEISFLIDEQIKDISSGGGSRKFWKQMLDLSKSSTHPEKYITKGGKALYCVEHLGVRGAAIIPHKEPKVMPFQSWVNAAGQTIGPFTPQYLYGGCCDMDYFMRHVLEKKQERIKTVMQVIKYLERQAWMLDKSQKNANLLPGGLKLRIKHIDHLSAKGKAIRSFCQNAIDNQVWRNPGRFKSFINEGFKKSANTCIAGHFLSISMGNALLWRVDDGDITQAQAVMLDEIAYDLKTVHYNRYGHGLPNWYTLHEKIVYQETIDFLANYKKRHAKVYKLLAKAGILPPKDEMLTTTEVGPISPPPVIGIAIEEITMNPKDPKEGENVKFSAKVKIKGAIEELPDWDEVWMDSIQKKAMEQVAVWSWLASIRRMEISYLMKQDAENKKKMKTGNCVYVSPYEIQELITEELEMCEDEIVINSEKLGLKPPDGMLGRFKPHLSPEPTTASVDEYLKALNSTLEQTRIALELLNAQSSAFIEIAENDAKSRKSGMSERVRENIKTLGEMRQSGAKTLDSINTAVGKFNQYKGYAESLRKVSGGDFWEAAAKSKELQAYLEKLSDQTDTAVTDAIRIHNGLNKTVRNMILQMNPQDRKGEHASLYKSMEQRMISTAKKKNDLNLNKIPELKERAKWLKRGKYAAKAAKYALIVVSAIKDYNQASEKLKSSDLNAQTEKAVIALAVAGNIIIRGADYIPIKVLRSTIKDYASLLAQAPIWSTAFDTMIRRKYQGIGYDVRSALIPEAYNKLIYNDKNLEAGRFYRYNGPFAAYNNLIIFGYPTQSTIDKGKNKELPEVDIRNDQLWLIWDKSKPNGFLKLSTDTFRKASLYSSWFRRAEGRNISGTELHDLLISREIPGAYFFSASLGLSTIKRKAEDIRRMSAIKDFLALTTGKKNFTPGEVHRYYGFLDRSARMLAKEGFVINEYDIKEIFSKVWLEAPIDGSWKTVMKSIPFTSAMPGLINKGSSAWDSLSGGEKERLKETVKKLISKKKKLRAEARERFWEENKDDQPAGLRLEDIKLSIKHKIISKDKTIKYSDLKTANRDEFTITWKTILPEKIVKECNYIFEISLVGYKDSADAAKKEFFVKEKPKEEKEDKKIPREWKLIDKDDKRYYVYKGSTNEVGLYKRWHTNKRRQIFFICKYDENSHIHGLWVSYHQSNGALMTKINYNHGVKEGKELHYFKDGQLSGEWSHIHGLLQGKSVDYQIGRGNKRYLLKEGNYVNDLAVGEHKRYYDNGNLKKVSIKGSDGYDVSVVEYYEDGKSIMIEKRYNRLGNGRSTSTGTYYDEKGNVIKKW